MYFIIFKLYDLSMSQSELSRRTGISTSTINDWKKKKINPQADKLVVISRALDMLLADLLEKMGMRTAASIIVLMRNISLSVIADRIIM